MEIYNFYNIYKVWFFVVDELFEVVGFYFDFGSCYFYEFSGG